VQSELNDKLQQKKLKNNTIKTQLENATRQFQQERIMLDSVTNSLKDVRITFHCVAFTDQSQERAKIAAELAQAKEKAFGLKRTNSQIESEKSQLMVH
jgi:hypothetical protein